MVENLCGKGGKREGVNERGGIEGKREKDREFNLMCNKKEAEKEKIKFL